MTTETKPFACADVAGMVRSMEKLVHENDAPVSRAFQASFASFCGGLDPAGLPETFFPTPSEEAQTWRTQVLGELSRGVPAPVPRASTPETTAASTGGVRFHFTNGEEVWAEPSHAQRERDQAMHTLDFYMR